MRTALTLATNIIREFEGCSLVPYLCPAGFWTIGYGSTVLSDGRPVTDLTKPITQPEADALLCTTIQNVQKQVREVVKRPLAPNQEAALISLTYNIGIGNFERSTLLKLLNKGQIDQAAEQFLRWNKSHGQTLNGLTRRRKAERAAFLGENL
ncbi:lysozyme [Aristophania vespae]|uniref:lysozyme n=1 Tax=Aristophania vespae TaxID=2697033 RepID=UPI002351A274|nr:lysozyme [Aristophania vespae]UMM63089.1 Lysozyme RrrD [Aristophania vespae]